MKKTIPSFSFRNYTSVVSLALAVVCFASCKQLDVYEKNTPVPAYQWQYSLQPSFDFNITDTVSLYNIYVVLRHTDGYRYNNIWLNVGTQFPGDTLRQQHFDMQLGSDAKGWEGTGMDDIWEVRKTLTRSPVKLSKPGNYKFSVAQIMRENPLPNIMSVGIRVERVR